LSDVNLPSSSEYEDDRTQYIAELNKFEGSYVFLHHSASECYSKRNSPAVQIIRIYGSKNV